MYSDYSIQNRKARNQISEDREQKSEDRYPGFKSSYSTRHALCYAIFRNPQPAPRTPQPTPRTPQLYHFVKRVLDYPFRPMLKQLGNEFSNRLFTDDDFYGKPLGLI